MPLSIPITLCDLAKKESEGNPVVVAGYGRESTHKGYLHWILTSYRWPGAIKAACLLIKHLGHEVDESRITLSECLWEQRFGNRTIDLILTLYEDNVRVFKLPIELKADSGESGEGQLKEFSGYAKGDTSISACAAFLLGAMSVQNIDLGDFKPILPNDLLKIWEPLYDDGPSFLKDWLDAVALEESCRNLAHEVYKEWKVDGAPEPWWKYGYRSSNHLMMYVLDNVRTALKDKKTADDWALYLLRYNAVLNLDSKTENWQTIQGNEPCQWFFEFNDDYLILKVWTGKKCTDIDRLKQWVWDKRDIILKMDIPSCPKPEPPGKTKWGTSSFTVCSWKVDLSEIGKIPGIVQTITDQVRQKALK